MHVISSRAVALVEPRGVNGFGASQTTIRLGETLKADVEAYIFAHRAEGFNLTPSQVIRAAVALFVQSYFDSEVEIGGVAIFKPVPNPAANPIGSYGLASGLAPALGQSSTGPYGLVTEAPIAIPQVATFQAPTQQATVTDLIEGDSNDPGKDPAVPPPQEAKTKRRAPITV